MCMRAEKYKQKNDPQVWEQLIHSCFVGTLENFDANQPSGLRLPVSYALPKSRRFMSQPHRSECTGTGGAEEYNCPHHGTVCGFPLIAFPRVYRSQIRVWPMTDKRPLHLFGVELLHAQSAIQRAMQHPVPGISMFVMCERLLSEMFVLR